MNPARPTRCLVSVATELTLHCKGNLAVMIPESTELRTTCSDKIHMQPQRNPRRCEVDMYVEEAELTRNKFGTVRLRKTTKRIATGSR